MTEPRRTYHFPSGEPVYVALTAKGEYVAYQDDVTPRGYGHSHMAAIADLNDKIAAYEADDEEEQLQWQGSRHLA
jgi:hypothetical protein